MHVILLSMAILSLLIGCLRLSEQVESVLNELESLRKRMDDVERVCRVQDGELYMHTTTNPNDLRWCRSTK